MDIPTPRDIACSARALRNEYWSCWVAELRATRDAAMVVLPSLLVYRSLGQFALPDGALAVLGREDPQDDAAATLLAAAMRQFTDGLAGIGISPHSAGLWF